MDKFDHSNKMFIKKILFAVALTLTSITTQAQLPSMTLAEPQKPMAPSFDFLETKSVAIEALPDSAQDPVKYFIYKPRTSSLYDNLIELAPHDSAFAFKVCDKLIELYPEEAGTYIVKGGVKRILKDLRGAVADYNIAIQKDSTNGYFYNNRSFLKLELGDTLGSVNDLDKAIEIEPNIVDYRRNRIELRYMLGDSAGMYEDFTAIIEITQQSAEAYFNRGSFLSMFKNDEAAIEDYNKAAELDPDYPMTYLGRAISYMKLAQKEKKFFKSQRLMGKSIKDDQKYHKLARRYQAAKKPMSKR